MAVYTTQGAPMTASLPDLLDHRTQLLQELSQLGDFQPGSITNVTRRCGKPNCHCAKPSDPGHGPHRQLTQKIDGKTVTKTLSSPEALRKAEKETGGFCPFQKLSPQLNDINQKVLELAPPRTEAPTPGKKKRLSSS